MGMFNSYYRRNHVVFIMQTLFLKVYHVSSNARNYSRSIGLLVTLLVWHKFVLVRIDLFGPNKPERRHIHNNQGSFSMRNYRVSFEQNLRTCVNRVT
jgi:hypothetical protein